MAKENNTWSFPSVVSGWTKVTKEHHSQACLAQRRRCSCVGVASQKISPGLFFAVWLAPLKTAKFNHPRKFVPIQYTPKLRLGPKKDFKNYLCSHKKQEMKWISIFRKRQLLLRGKNFPPHVLPNYMYMKVYSSSSSSSSCCCSLTARSTRCSLPMRTCCCLSGPISLCSTVMVKIV